MLKTARLLVPALVLGACGGGGSDGGHESPLDGGTRPAVVYEGSVTTTFETIDLSVPGGIAGTETATNTTRVLRNEPLQARGDGEESNPFHLEVAPHPARQALLAGMLHLVSSYTTWNPSPPPDEVLVQSWSYTRDTSSGRLEGSLTRLLTHDPNNFLVGTVLGGPFSMGGQKETCVAGINKGATIAGTVTESAVDLTVEGTAGGYFVGPTCMTEIRFSARIVATRAAAATQAVAP